MIFRRNPPKCQQRMGAPPLPWLSSVACLCLTCVSVVLYNHTGILVISQAVLRTFGRTHTPFLPGRHRPAYPTTDSPRQSADLRTARTVPIKAFNLGSTSLVTAPAFCYHQRSPRCADRLAYLSYDPIFKAITRCENKLRSIAPLLLTIQIPCKVPSS